MSTVPSRLLLLSVGLSLLACLPGCAATPDEPLGIHYDDLGSGERGFLMIPGWCSDKRVWDDQREAFAAVGRTLLIDLPGHGDSAPSTSGYDFDTLADGLAAVLDDAGVEAAVLLGHSNGTPLARHFARRHPERTLGLVAVDGSFLPMMPDDPEALAAIVDGFRGEQGAETARMMFKGMLHPDLSDEREAELLGMLDGVTEEARIGTFLAAAAPAVWESDPVAVPVLAVMAASPFWTSDYWTEAEPLLPDLTRHELPGVSHFLQVDKPERFNRIVLDWVAERGLLD